MSELTNNKRNEVKENSTQYSQTTVSRQFSTGRIAVVAIAAMSLLATRLVPDLDPVITAGLTYASFGLLLGMIYLTSQAQAKSQQRAPRPIRVRVTEERRVDERTRTFEGR